MTNMLNIYTYLDYRKYLADYYNVEKKNTPSFSYRLFSQKVGVKAPNFLQWLIEGKRNLAKATILPVAKALNLSKSESQYFEILVFFCQAKTIADKKRYFALIKKHHTALSLTMIEDMQIDHYAQWYNEAIRELLNYYPFNPNETYAFRNLAKQLNPAITEKQARLAIKQMLKLKLLVKTEKGFIQQHDSFISTGDEVNSFLVRGFHQSMISLALDAQDRIEPCKRDVSALTMSISGETFDLIKQEVQLFRKKLMELVKLDNKPDNVYQMNFQLFPLTRTKK